MLLLSLVGCGWTGLLPRGCQQPEERLPAEHYLTAHELHDAVVEGDLDGLRELARGLDGAVVELSGAAAEARDRLAGAAGFLMVAEDAEEAADGVAAVASACGSCHLASGYAVPAGELAEPTHGAGARAMWLGLMAPDPTLFDAGRQAFSDAHGRLPPDREAAYARALSSCAECHAERGVLR